MEADSFDVIVIGVGAMGAAACHALAARGKRVLGLERFSIPHERGSSHGESRIFRIGYYEHPDYVPLLQTARKLWLQLESTAGATLLHQIGGLWMGPHDSTLIAGTLASSQQHGLQHELLNRSALAARFPQFKFDSSEDITGFFEADAGLLEPELAVKTLATLARNNGAAIHESERVLDWKPSGSGIIVETDHTTYQAKKLIVCAGPWSTELLQLDRDKLNRHPNPRSDREGNVKSDFALAVTRQPTAWFHLKSDSVDFRAERMPCWGVVRDESAFYYGFPALRDRQTVKISLHHTGNVCDPEDVDQEVSADEIANLKEFTDRTFPGEVGDVADTKVCLYTNTSDGHFVLDHHPDYDGRVVIAAGFSGHGFKFVPLIGEVLADLSCDGMTKYPVEFLSLSRFAI